ncbi:uncharacterized protein LOC118407387 [Branchiostoma floridae]|uniref:Uncharacterized protein LOC118407387 n=1 Tax=Branchiostoma floridae TaxID=7739 RepID=A0A9J7HQ53_BRAFL|nr:uncharacterized protein LOC118407387 [Branchiostoma floridae]
MECISRLLGAFDDSVEKTGCAVHKSLEYAKLDLASVVKIAENTDGLNPTYSDGVAELTERVSLASKRDYVSGVALGVMVKHFMEAFNDPKPLPEFTEDTDLTKRNKSSNEESTVTCVDEVNGPKAIAWDNTSRNAGRLVHCRAIEGVDKELYQQIQVEILYMKNGLFLTSRQLSICCKGTSWSY